VTSAEEELRRLAINDERQIAVVMARPGVPRGERGLEPRTEALARLAALIALDAAPVSLERAVSDAIAQGASSEDIVSLLEAIAPSVGYPRVVAAAPALAAALGYDIDRALETLPRTDDPGSP
jgi:alkylhydroperoxidase/carboxymuconolactone decarboxylase family protein YurZ